MAERASINQRIQLGIETTPGTAVAASKIIDAWTLKMGPKVDAKQSTPTGRKYVSAQAINKEWMEFSIDSPIMDYNSMIYLLSSAFSAITPVAHGSSSTAKDWAVTPPVTGSASPKTFTIEQGSTERAHKFAHALLNKFGYKFSRAEASCSASGFGQLLSDGITMTSSPTRVAVIPATGAHFNVYLDPTSSALGTTQLTKFIDFEYSWDGVFNPVWYVNRSNSSFSTYVDAMPKATAKITLAADSNGMALLSNMRNSDTLFMRVQAQGSVIDNNQTVSLGSPSAGNFTLTYKGQTTSNIAYNAAASAVQTAFTGLSTVGSSNATVSGSNGGPYTITFPTSGTLATDTTAITGSGAGLTGGTFLITQTQIYDAFVHDMAVKISTPGDFTDADGVFAVPWELTVVEDDTYGAQTLTATNLLTSL